MAHRIGRHGRRGAEVVLTALLATALPAVSGCRFDPAGIGGGGPMPDGSVADAAVDAADASPDGEAPDGDVIADAADLDGTVMIDGAPPPDAFVFLDAAPPDAFVFMDAAVPDATIFMDAAPPMLGPGDLPATPNPVGGTIVIDGAFADWPTPLLTQTVSRDSTGAHDHIGQPPASDTDLSARVSAIYGTLGVYLRVEMRDNTIVTDSQNRFDDDSFSVQIDIAPLGGGFGNEDRRFYFRADDSSRDEFLNRAPGDDGIQVKTVAGTGMIAYQTEILIPWLRLGYAATPAAGTRIRFGMQLTDDDNGNGAEAWLAWFRGTSSCASCCAMNTHKDVWCDPTILGSLVVMP